jgi:hypothetical protein
MLTVKETEMRIDWMRGTAKPLIGAAAVESSSSWIDAGLRDPNMLQTDLQTLGYNSEEIAGALEERSHTVDELESISRRIAIYSVGQYYDTPREVSDLLRRSASLRQRFANFLDRRSFKVEEVTECEIRLPLFLLAAPEPKGCATSFKTASMEARSLAWGIRILGTGLGGDAFVKVTSSYKFAAGAGERKLVFLPMKVTLARVAILEGDWIVGQTNQVVASECVPGTNPGLLLLDAGAELSTGSPISTYPLAGDTIGGISTYEEKYESNTATKVTAGLTAFKTEVSFEAEVSLTREVVLSIELSGGFDYSMLRPADAEGIAWQWS